MTIQTLTVTAPDGSIHKRNTAANYTHVVMVYSTDRDGSKSWGPVAWASSEALATKQYDKWSKVSRFEQCIITPVDS